MTTILFIINIIMNQFYQKYKLKLIWNVLHVSANYSKLNNLKDNEKTNFHTITFCLNQAQFYNYFTMIYVKYRMRSVVWGNIFLLALKGCFLKNLYSCREIKTGKLLFFIPAVFLLCANDIYQRLVDRNWAINEVLRLHMQNKNRQKSLK